MKKLFCCIYLNCGPKDRRFIYEGFGESFVNKVKAVTEKVKEDDEAKAVTEKVKEDDEAKAVAKQAEDATEIMAAERAKTMALSSLNAIPEEWRLDINTSPAAANKKFADWKNETVSSAYPEGMKKFSEGQSKIIKDPHGANRAFTESMVAFDQVRLAVAGLDKSEKDRITIAESEKREAETVRSAVNAVFQSLPLRLQTMDMNQIAQLKDAEKNPCLAARLAVNEGNELIYRDNKAATEKYGEAIKQYETLLNLEKPAQKPKAKPSSPEAPAPALNAATEVAPKDEVAKKPGTTPAAKEAIKDALKANIQKADFPVLEEAVTNAVKTLPDADKNSVQEKSFKYHDGDPKSYIIVRIDNGGKALVTSVSDEYYVKNKKYIDTYQAGLIPKKKAGVDG